MTCIERGSSQCRSGGLASGPTLSMLVFTMSDVQLLVCTLSGITFCSVQSIYSVLCAAFSLCNVLFAATQLCASLQACLASLTRAQGGPSRPSQVGVPRTQGCIYIYIVVYHASKQRPINS